MDGVGCGDSGNVCGIPLRNPTLSHALSLNSEVTEPRGGGSGSGPPGPPPPQSRIQNPITRYTLHDYYYHHYYYWYTALPTVQYNNIIYHYCHFRGFCSHAHVSCIFCIFSPRRLRRREILIFSPRRLRRREFLIFSPRRLWRREMSISPPRRLRRREGNAGGKGKG